MKASEIVAELPEEPTPEREEQIINFIGLGYYLKPDMVVVNSTWEGHTAQIGVMSDALMLGEPDDFLRINATMLGEQRIADLLQMSMLTPKIADLLRAQAPVQIEPCTQTPDAKMAYTSRMVKHSQAVTNAVLAATKSWPEPGTVEMVGRHQIGLIADVGKDWVLTNQLAGKQSTAANYGWHTKVKPNPATPQNGPYKCPGGGYMWQTIGTAHNTSHVDYSQVVRLMGLRMLVDGKPMLFADVATHPDLCWLVSYEGPLTVLRHPKGATIEPVMNA